MKIVVVIPARLQSSRLPEKAIADIAGKPMVVHVFERALQAKGVDAVYIATDSQKIVDTVMPFTKQVVMTSASHESGTDRIAEAIESIACDAVINVQGDEPLIEPELITQMALTLKQGHEMVSAMHRIMLSQELQSPNVVKVVTNLNDEALYFSRSIIPHHRDDWESLLKHHEKIPEPLRFYKHIGIYGYTKRFLQQYCSWEQSYLEKLEKLEQLRVLEHGETIKMIETSYESIGVDTLEDLEQVRALFDNN